MSVQESTGKVQSEVSSYGVNGASVKAVERLSEEHYTAFLSAAALARRPSPIRGLLPLEDTPGLISLLAGKPNPSTFPFTSFSFTARSPFDPAQEETITVDGENLTMAFQYGPTAGLPKLIEWLYGLQEISHGRKRDEGWKLSVGAGSQDLIYKAAAAMINPGDSILVESPVYAGVIPIFQSLHCHQIEVETDNHGIRSDALRSILDNWPAGKTKPKVLYTVPYGCNPTGMTATTERRQQVLRLAREHNFIILEDDPYFYLYYGQSPRYPSYFSLEREEPEVGRVLRFDSLSKVLSAGMRIGFASGPAPLLNAIDKHTSSSNLQTSSLTQVIAWSLLQSWGYAGFQSHTEAVSAFYREKRDIFENAMKKYLTDLAEWSPPEAGMFYWFKLVLPDGDSEKLVRKNAFDKGVLALPGTVFLPNGSKTAYVRASFSLNPEGEVDEALKRLREAILEARQATSGA